MTDAEFERFYAETAAPLHAYLARVGEGAALADDLVQSAYVRFLTAARPPENSRARRVYLFRIARNLLTDELRRRSKERPLVVRHEGDPPGREHLDWLESPGPAVDCEAVIDVRRAFGSLSARDQELLWLAYVVGLTHREIGEVAAVRESSVRVLLHRARGRLSGLLHARGVGPEDLP